MLNGENDPKSTSTRLLRERSLIDAGMNRELEMLSGVLAKTFPVASEPDEKMRALLRAIGSASDDRP